MKQIQNELGTQILADFEEALSVKGVKVLTDVHVSCVILSETHTFGKRTVEIECFSAIYIVSTVQ